MFTKLLQLFKKNIKKTPLEDFTTELLVGVLESDEELRIKFLKDFLNIDSDYCRINTQRPFILAGYPDCIIDVLIEGHREICFIENKVNSKEGENQLMRYSKVLSKYESDGFKTKLIYCTKNLEPKKYTAHNFKQITWRDIADFFSQNSNSSIANLFIKYLNENNMSEDMTIYSKDLITMENFSRVHNLIYQNIENVKLDFYTKFGKENINDHRHTLKGQLLQYNRIGLIKSPVINSTKESVLLYGFDFSGKLLVQMFLDKNHVNYETFKKISKDVDGFDSLETINGISLISTENLGQFINDENSQDKIKEWFIEKFNQVVKFRDKTKTEIDWKI